MRRTPYIIVEQYKMAIELYKHEDDLNWRKLNNCFYVNLGLCAALSFISKVPAAGNTFIFTHKMLFFILSGLGVGISLAFVFAIWYGVKYLQDRKGTLRNIEDVLVEEYGGRYIVEHEKRKEVEREKSKGHLEISPTMWALKLVPLFLTLGWSVMFFWGLFRL